VLRQLADDGRMLGSAIRRRSRVKARTAMVRFAGTSSGLVRGWRAFKGARVEL
jgi:hypothetical protein